MQSKQGEYQSKENEEVVERQPIHITANTIREKKHNVMTTMKRD